MPATCIYCRKPITKGHVCTSFAAEIHRERLRRDKSARQLRQDLEAVLDLAEEHGWLEIADAVEREGEKLYAWVMAADLDAPRPRMPRRARRPGPGAG